MAFRRASPTPDKSPGIKEELSAFSKEAGIYLKGRTELLALEGEEAGRILGRRLAVLIIGIGALIVSYLAFLITVIYLLGQWFEHLGAGLLANWAGAALLMTIAHLIIAFIKSPGFSDFILSCKGAFILVKFYKISKILLHSDYESFLGSKFLKY